MTRFLLVSVCIVVAFLACGKPPKVCDPDALLQKPQICPDRTAFGFGTEFGSATYIGSRPVDTFIIRNGGIEDLVIDQVGTSGDQEFKYKGSWDGGLTTSVTVKGNKTIAIQVEFVPTAGRASRGSLTVSSNAQNEPTLILKVLGCGLPSDGGTSTCYPDGGLSP